MKWSVHPAQKNNLKTVFALFFIIVFLGFIAIFYSVFFCILGFILFFAALHSYFFPTKYEINEEHLIIKNIFFTQRRNLDEFKKVYRGKNGILLSPFTRKTFLNRFRGVFLLVPGDNVEIEGYVRSVIEPPVEKNP
jgi:hypothetical protein